MIDKCFMHGKWYYSIEDIERCICKDAGLCQMRLLLPQMDSVDTKRRLDLAVVASRLSIAGDAAPGYLTRGGSSKRR